MRTRIISSLRTPYFESVTPILSFYRGSNKTQIDFILVKHRDRRVVTDAKFATPRLRHVERCGPPRIKWWQLKENTSALVSRIRLPTATTVDETWKDATDTILQAARSEFVHAKKAAKKAVAVAKAAHYDELSDKFEMRMVKDIVIDLPKYAIVSVNDDSGHLLMNRKRAMKLWHDYFERISTVEFAHPLIACVPPTQGPMQKIIMEETEAALKRMKPGKATSPDDIAADLWRSRCWNPAEWLTKFFNRLLRRRRFLVVGSKARRSRFGRRAVLWTARIAAQFACSRTA
ncbi:unnamed protein product [Heligmosomoides polygyrus]|uniref:Uncharacterized protein n=1 Tax=Heligmosomoides polygyrus TaxID=6339 RepID=A0A183F586_HELPZ|nr:unnamed protein product [Heligmosomoides polygyrus]